MTRSAYTELVSTTLLGGGGKIIQTHSWKLSETVLATAE